MSKFQSFIYCQSPQGKDWLHILQKNEKEEIQNNTAWKPHATFPTRTRNTTFFKINDEIHSYSAHDNTCMIQKLIKTIYAISQTPLFNARMPSSS